MAVGAKRPTLRVQSPVDRKHTGDSGFIIENGAGPGRWLFALAEENADPSTSLRSAQDGKLYFLRMTIFIF
jgi:hypothetical protein